MGDIPPKMKDTSLLRQKSLQGQISALKCAIQIH
jgi:hypothetical protein